MGRECISWCNLSGTENCGRSYYKNYEIEGLLLDNVDGSIYFSLFIEQQTGYKLGKEYIKAVFCHSAYLTSMQSTSCEILGWMNHKLKSRLPGEISTTSDDTTLMAESEEELKCLLMRVKEESEKSGLKLNFQKAKIMASGPITSWTVEREKVEMGTDFIFLGSKITVDSDCSHEIKRHSLLGRKAVTNLDSILKSRDITWPKKVRLVKGMAFPVVMYGCELDYKES